MALLNQLLKNMFRFAPLIFLITLITPLVLVLLSLFGEYNDNWNHLYNYVLPNYVFNSISTSPIKEKNKKDPINFYGYSKHLGDEKIFKILKKFFIQIMAFLYMI